MCKTMKEVCKERYLMSLKEGLTERICGECVFDKNLDGHFGDCDFIIEKTNAFPREVKEFIIDYLLNSTTIIERINYLKSDEVHE